MFGIIGKNNAEWNWKNFLFLGQVVNPEFTQGAASANASRFGAQPATIGSFDSRLTHGRYRRPGYRNGAQPQGRVYRTAGLDGPTFRSIPAGGQGLPVYRTAQDAFASMNQEPVYRTVVNPTHKSRPVFGMENTFTSSSPPAYRSLGQQHQPMDRAPGFKIPHRCRKCALRPGKQCTIRCSKIQKILN